MGFKMLAFVLLCGCKPVCEGRSLASRDDFAAQYGTQLYEYYTTCLEPGTYSPDTQAGVIEFVEQRALILERCGGNFDSCAAAICLEELASLSDCSLPTNCDLDGVIFTPACDQGDTAR